MTRHDDFAARSEPEPADERLETELRPAPVSGENVERLRPVTRSRLRTGALPALVAIAVVLTIGVGAVAAGFVRAPFVGFGVGGDAYQPTGLVGCFGAAPGFSPSVLTSAPANAETADTGPAAALRALLASPDAQMPVSGWIAAYESGSQTEFVQAGASSAGGAEVTVEPGSPGPGNFGADGWHVTGYGSCMLFAVPTPGYGVATWALNASMPYSRSATELHVLVDEWECHGDATAEGRIAQNLAYSRDALVVTLAIRPLGGAQTCPGTPPTPYVLQLTEPVGSRDLVDGGRWPPETIATGGQVVIPPTPAPEPSNWHMPMDCTGEGDGPGSFKAVSMSATFDVYCAALPAGWQRQSMSDYQRVVTLVTVTYRGPNGEILELTEGDFCSDGQSACAPGEDDLGKAMFGDREGQLVGRPPGADFALYVAPGQSPSWKATGTGMSLDTFKALAAALIVVAK